MAKTQAGKKIVPVKTYSRKVEGKKQRVSPHRRSTPKTSTGRAKGR